MLSVLYLVHMQDSGQIQRKDIPEDCFVVYQGWWMHKMETWAGPGKRLTFSIHKCGFMCCRSPW